MCTSEEYCCMNCNMSIMTPQDKMSQVDHAFIISLLRLIKPTGRRYQSNSDKNRPSSGKLQQVTMKLKTLNMKSNQK